MSDRIGIQFTERMDGHVAFGERDAGSGERVGRAAGIPLSLLLTIEIDDARRFRNDPRHEARVTGWLDCDVLGPRQQVTQGTVALFGGDHGPERRQMRYRMALTDTVGRPLTLEGVKTVGAGRLLSIWPDTTTLAVRILRAAPGDPADDDDATERIALAGVAHLGPRAFLRQLASFRASGRNPPRQLAEIGAFGRWFAARLWRAWRRQGAWDDIGDPGGSTLTKDVAESQR